MNRRQQVKEIFAAALELAAEERQGYLRDACGDPDVHREVVAMLEAYEAAGSFLDQPPLADPGAFAGPSLVGRAVASYRIDRLLGEGGMGQVYLALRADGAYRKEVAIKTIRGLAQGEEANRRFLVERQILAHLEHPCIAKLLDGGQTDDGLLYIVMEYVDGEPIDVYCRRRGLGVRQRLELFRQVCDAVFFAHNNLVVHRDLKPGNILVTADGVPKLLDFGIAKVLDPGLAADSAMTATSVRPMTPSYASPEQVRGEPITTASDVFALGVVLYELLTGVKPFRPSRSGPWQGDELARLICEADSEKPSLAVLSHQETEFSDTATTLLHPVEGRAFAEDDDSLGPEPSPEPETAKRARASARALGRRLAGDIDTVVAKAMAKEPGRRYASVERLSEDIRRHLEDLPILARPETLGYRLGKFVRRSPLLATALGLIGLLVGGLAWLTLEVVQQRDRAELERATAVEVSDFTLDLFKGSDPAERRGEEITLGEFLDLAATRIRAELEGRPEVRATMMDMIGSMYYRLGRYGEAREQLEQALAIRRRVLEPDSAGIADSLDVLAQTHVAAGEDDLAEPLYREVVALRRLRGESEPLARSLNNQGLFLASQGELEAASRSIEESLTILNGVLPENDPALATVSSSLASVLHAQGRLEEAMPRLRYALEIHREVSGQDHPNLPLHVHNLGQLIVETGRFHEAEPLLEEAASEARRLLGPEHLHTLLLCNSHGDLLRRRGRSKEAVRVLAACHEIGSETLGSEHPDVLLNAGNLVMALVEQGELERARVLVGTMRAMEAPENRSAGQRARLDYLEGRLLLAQDQPREAEVYLRRALDRRRENLRPTHPVLASNLVDLGLAIEASTGEPSQAEVLYREAMEIHSQALAEEHPDRAPSLLALARLMHRRGDHEAAAPLLERARALVAEPLVVDAPLARELTELWRENQERRTDP